MLPRVLTVAGSDCSGGAGIQADLKTFTVFRVYGMSAITALTAQNTIGVTGILPVAPDFVRAQIDAVATDIGIDAAKTGMLASAEIIRAVADAVRAHGIDLLVVDPVLNAGTGAPLLHVTARHVMILQLLPLAALVTPNAIEAADLAEMPVTNTHQMCRAAEKLVGYGARAALVKGGHLDGEEAIDILYDGQTFHELRAPRVANVHTHGTGCMLSAAITANLAKGLALLDAVRIAKRFISAAIAGGLAIGKGNGPANPLAWLDDNQER